MLKYSAFLTLCLLSLAGCSGEIPGPAPQAGTPTPVPAEPPVAPTVPDGNSEPDLSDAATPADGVTLQVVKPDEFNAVVAQHRGKVVLVDFWALWCDACVKTFPHTVELSKKHATDGLVVISMSFDDPEQQADALAFLKEQDATFENLMCALGGSTDSFAAYENETEALPYFRLYDRGGKLAQVFKVDIDAGKGIDPADIDKAVAELLATPAP